MDKTKTIEDDSIMEFGIHKGKTMEDVPASYLLFLYSEKKCPPNYMEYIEDNLQVLEKQQKEEKFTNRPVNW